MVVGISIWLHVPSSALERKKNRSGLLVLMSIGSDFGCKWLFVLLYLIPFVIGWMPWAVVSVI